MVYSFAVFHQTIEEKIQKEARGDFADVMLSIFLRKDVETEPEDPRLSANVNKRTMICPILSNLVSNNQTYIQTCTRLGRESMKGFH